MSKTVTQDGYEEIYSKMICGLPSEVVRHITSFLHKRLDQQLYNIDILSRKVSISKSIMFLNN
jgi:hypothetical protein